MNELLLALMLITPLALALMQGWALKQGCGPRNGWADHLTAWAALPGLLLALLGTEFVQDVPWLLLGSQLGLDQTGRVFLGLTAVLWLAAGIYAQQYMADDPRRRQFQAFFLVTMAGNLGVTIAQDGLSFLAFFTLMSLAAYGLIVHDRRATSLQAGVVYIVMTVAGEMLLFVAMLLIALQADTLRFDGLAGRLAASAGRDWVIGLLLAGFGIKMGIMPLHVWLPLAHPAAPTPASAVLSGAMIKTGLLGLMRTLPLGTEAFPQWGKLCLLLGVATYFLSAFIGMTQRHPKVVLAYSSISQMGLILITLAIALLVPTAWPLVGSALLVWVVHHGIAKSALFLGVGIAGTQMRSTRLRALFVATMALPGLALAGLPWTMGFTAKGALKYSCAMVEPWSGFLAGVLLLSGLTTTVLVLRFLWLIWPEPSPSHGRLTAGLLIPWFMLSLAVVVNFFFLQNQPFVDPAWSSLTRSAVWAGTWPIVGASLSVTLISRLFFRWDLLARVYIPAGDIVGPIATITRRVRRRKSLSRESHAAQTPRLSQGMRPQSFPNSLLRRLDSLAELLENDTIAGLIFALLAVALLLISLS